MKIRTASTFAIFGALLASGHAQTLFSDTFESATLGGQLYNQTGWDSFGDTGYVVSNTQSLGTKSVKVDFATAGWTAGSRWNYPDLNYAAAGKTVVTTTSVYLGSGYTAGSLFGLDAYDSAVARVAAVRINAQTGAVSFVTGTTATATNAVAPLNAWVTLSLSLNYTTKIASATLNGVNVGTSVAFTTGVTNTLSDVDLYAVKLTGETGNSAYFDNYSVAVQAVPEPATMAVLGLGVVAFVRRRKRA